MLCKIVIIGMGYVGLIVVYYIVVNGFVDDFVFIDMNISKVEVDVFDFQDVMFNLFYYMNIIINDYSSFIDVDVIILVIGNIKL